MKGRKPVPTALKILRGNPGRRALTVGEPKPRSDDAYPAPEWLDEEARAEWARLEPELVKIGLLTRADLPAFAAYCAEVGTFQSAARELAHPTRKLSGGRRNLLLGFRRKASQEMRRWAAEFGLTPAARVRLKSEPPPPEDPLAKYRRPAAG